MNIKEFFSGAFRAAKEEGFTLDGDHATADDALAALTPADPRIAALQAQIATMQAQQYQTAAAAFADGLVSARRATPAERDTLAAAYLQASADDAARPIATARTALLEAASAARTPHVMTQELVGDGRLVALANQAATGSDDAAARNARFLKMTPMGRLAAKGKQ